MTKLTANKGEWSELYALGHLLAQGSGRIANSDYAQPTNRRFKLLEIIDPSNSNHELQYQINDEHIEVYRDSKLVKKIDRYELNSSVETFLRDLLNTSSGSSFTLNSGEKVMQLLEKLNVSANSNSTFDLFLTMIDHDKEISLFRKGYSIKSEIGNKATIFNASNSTNFIYRVDSSIKVGKFADVSPVKSNLQELFRNGHSLQFIKLQSPILESNLRSIDKNLPETLAELLLAYYRSSSTKLIDIVPTVFPQTSLSSKSKLIAFKKFLGAASMGLKAGSTWNGYPENFGGLLLVEKQGSIMFYLYEDLSSFEEYLFKNLRFETPSATRHNFGQIEDTNNIQFIRLNLQIRY